MNMHCIQSLPPAASNDQYAELLETLSELEQMFPQEAESVFQISSRRHAVSFYTHTHTHTRLQQTLGVFFFPPYFWEKYAYMTKHDYPKLAHAFIS